MHIAYKLLFQWVVTQVHKTLHSEKPFPSLLALGASGFSHPAQLLELVISSVCSTSILSPTTSVSACPVPLCCDFYFVGLWLMTIHTCMCLRSCSAWWDARWSGLSKPWPLGRTVLEKTLEAAGQWAGFDEGRCFWGVSSVSISSPSAEPRRSPGSVLRDPPEMLLVAAGLHSSVSSYRFTNLRERDSCMLGEDMAHFYPATLSFSTKAFTSNCSSPLPKKSSFSSFK